MSLEQFLSQSIEGAGLKPAFSPTPEQAAIVDAAQNTSANLMLVAMAGCAKTTTLEMIAQVLPTDKPSLALAFNVKTKKELEKRFPTNFTILTMNGLGHRAWQKVVSKKLQVEDKKIFDITKEFVKQHPDASPEDFSTIMGLVRKARSAGLVPDKWVKARGQQGLLPDTEDSWEELADLLYLDITPELIYAARTVLEESIRQAYQGIIDYDDQIYMSTMFGGVFPRYDLVMVDEAQDLSPLNHIQLARCAAERLIVCGDPRQAIYAFRGADSSSMDTMRKLRERWIDLPLSLTFRCPKEIVARQQHHAPGFTAAESNRSGSVLQWGEKTWSITEVENLAPGSIAILCRNNAPLLACALRIIKSGKGCTIIGSEIGKGLIALSKKICPRDDTDNLTSLGLIEAWAEGEISKARANEKEERVAIIQDKRDCLLAVMDSAPTITAGDSRRLLATMFSNDNLRITLSTGHKSKGLEWLIVVHLDPFRVPSKFARNQFELGNKIPMEQDLNLKYVIETRSQEFLIMANLEQMT